MYFYPMEMFLRISCFSTLGVYKYLFCIIVVLLYETKMECVFLIIKKMSLCHCIHGHLNKSSGQEEFLPVQGLHQIFVDMVLTDERCFVVFVTNWEPGLFILLY